MNTKSDKEWCYWTVVALVTALLVLALVFDQISWLLVLILWPVGAIVLRVWSKKHYDRQAALEIHTAEQHNSYHRASARNFFREAAYHKEAKSRPLWAAIKMLGWRYFTFD